MSDWTIILRSLRARLFSTATTVVTVAIGVGLLLVLLVLRAASMSSFDRGTGNVHLLVSRDQSQLVSVLNGLFYAQPPARPIMNEEYERLRALPLEWAVPAQLGDSYLGRWPVLATTDEFFTKFRPAEDAGWEFASGRVFEKNFEVVVGAAAARGAGLRVGDQIELTHGVGGAGAEVHVHDEDRYTVVGILRPTGTAHDRALFTSLASSWIVHARERLEREHAAEMAEDPTIEHHEHEVSEESLLEKDKKLTTIFLRVLTRPGSDVSASVPVVMEMIRRDPGFAASPLTVAGPRAEIERLRGIVGNVDQIVLAMAGAVMVSAAVGIMLALHASMEQRRRQIAVLRVLGASAGRVFGLVLTESALIGLAGAAGGVVLAAIAGRLAAAELKARVGIVVNPDLPPATVAGVVLAAFVLACVAGLIPAAMGYRTSVAASLRPVA